MNLVSSSAFVIIVGIGFSYVLGHLEFAVMLFFSILPINILHGSKSYVEFKNDKTKYKGLKILTYPPLILVILMMINQIGIDSLAR